MFHAGTAVPYLKSCRMAHVLTFVHIFTSSRVCATNDIVLMELQAPGDRNGSCSSPSSLTNGHVRLKHLLRAGGGNKHGGLQDGFTEHACNPRSMYVVDLCEIQIANATAIHVPRGKTTRT